MLNCDFGLKFDGIVAVRCRVCCTVLHCVAVCMRNCDSELKFDGIVAVCCSVRCSVLQ